MLELTLFAALTVWTGLVGDSDAMVDCEVEAVGSVVIL
jgi:hypothetical protein